MRRRLAALTLAAALPMPGCADCVPAGPTASLAEIVARVEAEHLKYVFVGERHGIGPIKRFAVELANALLDGGDDVGLYVEGFRTSCPPQDESCRGLARVFNPQAFRTLLDESRASVHALDPWEGDLRAARMAATIAAGSETVRVVLVGRSHVVDAGGLGAEVWTFGGAMRFADPGDLAAEFRRQEYLTVGLETAAEAFPPYSLRQDGCGVDYVVTTADTTDYWGEPAAPLAQVTAAQTPDPASEPRDPSSAADGPPVDSPQASKPSPS